MKQRHWSAAVIAVALVGLAAEAAWAQRRGGRPNGRFEQRSPDVGQPLPDLTVFAADGKKVSLRSLRGSHTVLVFGCLT